MRVPGVIEIHRGNATVGNNDCTERGKNMTAWMRARNWGQALLLAATAMLTSTQTQAYTVSLAPAAQTVALGGLVAIDVQVSGLGPAGLGSYSLDLSFNPTILGFDHADDALSLGFAVGLFATPGTGTVGLTDVSFNDPDVLLARQGDAITLFTLYFNTLGVGTDALTFSAGGALADVFGNAVVFDTIGGEVTVTAGTGPGEAPTPGTLPLVLSAALALALARPKRPFVSH
jgi:hypothetical protein